MWKTIDIVCEHCGFDGVQLVDVPSGQSLPDTVACEACGHEAKRRISFNIAKTQIAERCRGGEVINGKVVRQATGHKAALEYSKLNKELKKQKRYGDKEVAREVHNTIERKKEEWKKDIK